MDAIPVIARGHNAAVFLPPVTEAAAPLLQAVPKRPVLALTPDADRAVALASGLSGAFAVSGLARAQRRLAAAAPDILCAGASDALALLRRSALRPAEYAAVVIAWPEQIDEEGTQALEAIMAECDKEAQRLIVTAETGPAGERLVERYAFKAMTYGFAGPDTAPWTTVGGARYLVARAGQLAEIRRRVLDALNPEQDEQVVVATTPATREAAAELVARAGATPPVIVAEAFQIPWLRSLFMPLSHLALPTSADAAEQRAEKLRARIARIVEGENLDRELLVVAPLFERYDPATVAAGLLRMVAAQAGQGAAAATGARLAAPESTAPGVPSFAKVWVGVGKKDNVKPGDLVGAIVNEAKVAADALGKIEVKDLFCLVEVRAEQAEKVVQGLTGVNLRGRRLTARVDRGPGQRPPRRV